MADIVELRAKRSDGAAAFPDVRLPGSRFWRLDTEGRHLSVARVLERNNNDRTGGSAFRSAEKPKRRIKAHASFGRGLAYACRHRPLDAVSDGSVFVLGGRNSPWLGGAAPLSVPPVEVYRAPNGVSRFEWLGTIPGLRTQTSEMSEASAHAVSGTAPSCSAP